MATIATPAEAPRVTETGQPVYQKTTDHLSLETRYQAFNSTIALWITKNVGTMTCFWAFTLLALLSLPATLHLVGWLPQHWLLPAFMMTYGFIYLIQWVAQSYIQLVLLPGLMVGQNLQNVAADVRAEKTFTDVEHVIDLLRIDTEGGLKDLYEKLHAEIQALKMTQ